MQAVARMKGPAHTALSDIIMRNFNPIDYSNFNTHYFTVFYSRKNLNVALKTQFSKLRPVV